MKKYLLTLLCLFSLPIFAANGQDPNAAVPKAKMNKLANELRMAIDAASAPDSCKKSSKKMVDTYAEYSIVGNYDAMLLLKESPDVWEIKDPAEWEIGDKLCRESLNDPNNQ